MFLDNRNQLISSVAGSTCSVDFPALPEYLARCIDADNTRFTNLQHSNTDRSTEIAQAIRKAADSALSTERARLYIPRRYYVTNLHKWLALRYKAFGLECHPCKRTIRAALKEWTPPNGDALKA